MNKKENKFEIYEFDEYNEDGSGIVRVKVSTKAKRLALKAQDLFVKHGEVVNKLFDELQKDNPDIDFSDFWGDQFAMFTGQVLN